MIQLPVEPKLTKYLYHKASLAKTPLSVSFELTPLCNMACRMCYVRMDRKIQESIAPLRSCDEWLKIAEEARKHGLLYILLTGGEPFTHPEFRQILSGLHRRGFIISINTNGTLIDEQTVEWLKKTPPSRVNLTLYGASDETYARLCDKPDGFTRATRAISLLKEAGITVKINISLTPYNADDLEGIFAYCKEQGLLISATSYMFPPLRRDSSCIGRNARFTPEQAAYYAAKIESLLNGEEAFLHRSEENDFSALADAFDEECGVDDADEGDAIRCRAGKCTGWVTWEGKLLACGMIPDEGAPNVFDTGYMNAWKIVTEKTGKIRLPATCSRCSAKDTCKACAAMVYTETGNFHTVPEYRCRMTHAYPGQFMKLAEEIKTRIEEDK